MLHLFYLINILLLLVIIALFFCKKRVILSAVILVFICLFFYNFQFLLTEEQKNEFLLKSYLYKIPLSKENGDWGTFGDFFGGVMNPILGFINLFLLSTTLSLQIKSSREQSKNTQIQEISARIVAIGHLLDITSQQIKHLSEHSHLLKDDETKLLKNLNANYKIHLEELDKAYKDLKNLKQDANNGTH